MAVFHVFLGLPLIASSFNTLSPLVLVFIITVTYAGRLWDDSMDYLFEAFEPASPSGAGGAASSALSLGLDDVPASPAASLLASEAAALGAYVTVIMNTST